MVLFSIGEEGQKLCHPLPTIRTFVLIIEIVLCLVEVKDAGTAESVAAVCLHLQFHRLIADRAFSAKTWMRKKHLKR